MHNIKTTIAAIALTGFSTLTTAQTFHLVVPINMKKETEATSPDLKLQIKGIRI